MSIALGGERILDRVSFDVAPGELCCLLGPSGCGKTTLLRVIGGLVAPSSGAVSIGGRSPREAWHEVAFVFQSPRLVPWRDALGNVSLGVELRHGRASRERAGAALELVGMAHASQKYPSVLSGGERQRIALARALAIDPRVLLMDEPFSALDIDTRVQLRTALLELWAKERKTILFVTHDQQEARVLAQHLVVLTPRPGRVLADSRSAPGGLSSGLADVGAGPQPLS